MPLTNTDYDDFRGTRAPSEAQRIDPDALARYLTAHIDGFRGPIEIAQFKGGQSNPTYKLTANGKPYVLRRKPPGKLLPSAHAVDREYRVISALANTDVPVARTYCLCTDDSVIGTMFYVMDYVGGRVLWDPALPGMDPGERRAIYVEANRVLATLHSVDFDAIGLGDFGKPGNYFARQIDRWTRQYRASETERLEAMDRLIDWLPQNIPPGERSCIVHGDYRLDNLIFDPVQARVSAVLDWELSTLGHPMADLSYHMMAWRLAASEFRGLRGCDIAALGIPTEDEYLRMYLQRVPQSQPPSNADWRFYMAYNMFRLAAILQGVMARAVAGNASSERAVQTGRQARPIAEQGWQQVEQRELDR